MKQYLPEKILGRKPIHINTDALYSEIRGKCVLVTGAAGSIGSEISRQIAHFEPALLLLSDISESPLHQLGLELKELFPGLRFIPLISDVRNPIRMEQIFCRHKPHLVYHAAAYKHVPLMESHPSESVLTNVWGTRVLADLSVRHEVEAFVMISTDKAVNPSNIMGATKRIAELYVQSPDIVNKAEMKDKNSFTRFIITRFGNVLGSNGSVMLHFKEQISKGGPVTVTHPDIVRYFMTVQEACQLVLEAGNMGKGGEVFVFDMGEPVRIVELAEKMIRIAGFEPHKDIKITYTGLRPGEKLYEELLTDSEHFVSTRNERILTGVSNSSHDRPDPKTTLDKINRLIDTARLFEDEKVVEQIRQLLPEFTGE